jgi:hypothetical protein
VRELRSEKVGCIGNRKRDRNKDVLEREKVVSGSGNDKYFGKTGDG